MIPAPDIDPEIRELERETGFRLLGRAEEDRGVRLRRAALVATIAQDADGRVTRVLDVTVESRGISHRRAVVIQTWRGPGGWRALVLRGSIVGPVAAALATIASSGGEIDAPAASRP